MSSLTIEQVQSMSPARQRTYFQQLSSRAPGDYDETRARHAQQAQERNVADLSRDQWVGGAIDVYRGASCAATFGGSESLIQARERAREGDYAGAAGKTAQAAAEVAVAGWAWSTALGVGAGGGASRAATTPRGGAPAPASPSATARPAAPTASGPRAGINAWGEPVPPRGTSPATWTSPTSSRPEPSVARPPSTSSASRSTAPPESLPRPGLSDPGAAPRVRPTVVSPQPEGGRPEIGDGPAVAPPPGPRTGPTVPETRTLDQLKRRLPSSEPPAGGTIDLKA